MSQGNKPSKRFEDLSSQAKLALVDWLTLSADRRKLDVTIGGLSTTLLAADLGQDTFRIKWHEMGDQIAELIDETVRHLDVKSKIKEIGDASAVERFRTQVHADVFYSAPTPSSTSAYRQPAPTSTPALPLDGVSKFENRIDWIACCGVWWSKTGWIGSTDWSNGHGQASNGNCRKCGKLLVSAEDRQKDASIKQYQDRLKETEPGNWVPFPASDPIQSGATCAIWITHHSPHHVTHLAIPERIAQHVTVHGLMLGCDPMLINGPLPGDLFAVRIHKDLMRSIDRGGSIRPGMLLPGLPCQIQVENKSGAPLRFEGALFGKPIDYDTPINYNTGCPPGYKPIEGRLK